MYTMSENNNSYVHYNLFHTGNSWEIVWITGRSLASHDRKWFTGLMLTTWHKLESSGERELQLKNWLHRLVCEYVCVEFSRVMINIWGLSPVWMVLCLSNCTKVSWIFSKSSKQHSSFVPTSVLVRVPTLTLVNDGLWKPNKPFPARVLLVSVLS